MGGAANIGANLSRVGLKWHANFREPRFRQLPVCRLASRSRLDVEFG